MELKYQQEEQKRKHGLELKLQYGEHKKELQLQQNELDFKRGQVAMTYRCNSAGEREFEVKGDVQQVLNVMKAAQPDLMSQLTYPSRPALMYHADSDESGDDFD